MVESNSNSKNHTKEIELKILTLSYSTIPEKLSNISNFSGVAAYYLNRELSNHNIEHTHFIVATDIRAKSEKEQVAYFNKIPITDVDHIVAMGIRFFSEYNPKCTQLLKKKIKGLVTGTVENEREEPTDIMFTFNRVVSKKAIYIGWGADPQLCYPDKLDDTLHILIDHSNYNKNRPDLSDCIAKQVQSLIDSKQYTKLFKHIKVRRFVDRYESGVGVEDFDSKHNVKYSYTRRGLSYVDACAEYRKAHIFIVTHPESLGLSVLESAMSGALVVSPEYFIKSEKINDVRHVLFKTKINWKVVLKQISVKKSVKKVKYLTWEKSFRTLIDTLKT